MKVIHIREDKLRTNIVIDDDLMSKALKVSGLPTKKAVIEQALERYIKIRSQGKLKRFRGKLKWEGNINEMRTPK